MQDEALIASASTGVGQLDLKEMWCKNVDLFYMAYDEFQFGPG